ncbi:Rv2253 family sensor-like surface protein [Mycobacterium sp. MMS18-G62]
MTRFRLSSFVGLGAASLTIALSLSPTATADAASWNGEYAITFIVGPKAGTSIAAGQPEVQYTDTYGFSSSCSDSNCTATITSGPPPRNPTVPQPIQFTWDGSSWTQVSDFQWDCMMDDGTIQWSPARADVRYTPQPDGSLSGTMHTDILSGPCQGTLEMNMTAERA